MDGMQGYHRSFVQDAFPFFRTRMSAVHRDVIADVSDKVGHAKSLLHQPMPRRRYT